MPDFSQNGLNLSWAAPAVSAGRQVLVHLSPASSANSLRLLCRTPGGPEQAVQAWPKSVDPVSGAQIFAAQLPDVPPGKTLHWRPVAQNGHRVADPGTTATLPGKPAEPPTASTPAPAAGNAPFPFRLQHLARVTVPLQNPPIVVGSTPDGLRIIYPLAAGGTVEGPHISGVVEHVGGDWMRVREDGIGIVDLRALVTTADGAKLMAEYSGVADFGPGGQAALLAGRPPAEININMAPRFLTADTRWAWINRLQLAAFGRVTMARMLVEYDLYAMRSEAVPAMKGTQDG